MDIFKKALQNSTVQILVVIGGLVVTMVNLYIASVLTPIRQDITEVVRRVDAIESTVNKSEPALGSIPKIETTLDLMLGRIDRIDNKLDRLIER